MLATRRNAPTQTRGSCERQHKATRLAREQVCLVLQLVDERGRARVAGPHAELVLQQQLLLELGILLLQLVDCSPVCTCAHAPCVPATDQSCACKGGSGARQAWQECVACGDAAAAGDGAALDCGGLLFAAAAPGAGCTLHTHRCFSTTDLCDSVSLKLPDLVREPGLDVLCADMVGRQARRWVWGGQRCCARAPAAATFAALAPPAARRWLASVACNCLACVAGEGGSCSGRAEPGARAGPAGS